MLGKAEQDVLIEYSNSRCLNCSTVYKRKWFGKEDLLELFNKHVASHPKGWDAVSGRYSLDNFYRELELYEQSIQDRDITNENRYRRALLSLLDSTYVISTEAKYRYLFEAVSSKNTSIFFEPEVKALLGKYMIKPVAFKRFSGFTDYTLWDYIISKTGPVDSYAELGCPLWGLLRIANEKGVKATFIRRNEPNYWGDPCKQNGKQCADHLNDAFGIQIDNWENGEGSGELIGFFQYLDHLESPDTFMAEVFSRFRHAAVILDKVDAPVYIQHLTGFTSQTMEYWATKYNKTLYADFTDILPSGNILYLFKG